MIDEKRGYGEFRLDITMQDRTYLEYLEIKRRRRRHWKES